jgi:hypothetical protein
MASFKNNLNEILILLKELSNEQRLVLFGNSLKFKRWLESNGINNNVRI